MSVIQALQKPIIPVLENWYLANIRHIFYKLHKANNNTQSNEIADTMTKEAANDTNSIIPVCKIA